MSRVPVDFIGKLFIKVPIVTVAGLTEIDVQVANPGKLATLQDVNSKVQRRLATKEYDEARVMTPIEWSDWIRPLDIIKNFIDLKGYDESGNKLDVESDTDQDESDDLTQVLFIGELFVKVPIVKIDKISGFVKKRIELDIPLCNIGNLATLEDINSKVQEKIEAMQDNYTVKVMTPLQWSSYILKMPALNHIDLKGYDTHSIHLKDDEQVK